LDARTRRFLHQIVKIRSIDFSAIHPALSDSANPTLFDFFVKDAMVRGIEAAM
jgi:hypothetical protein